MLSGDASTAKGGDGNEGQTSCVSGCVSGAECGAAVARTGTAEGMTVQFEAIVSSELVSEAPIGVFSWCVFL